MTTTTEPPDLTPAKRLAQIAVLDEQIRKLVALRGQLVKAKRTPDVCGHTWRRYKRNGLCDTCALREYRSAPATCHPRLRNHSGGLCHRCWKERRLKRKEKT